MNGGWWMSKAQVKASGFEECSQCLTRGRTLKDCSEIGACRGPWGMGIGMQYDKFKKVKMPRVGSPGWYAQTPVALRYPFQPYRGASMIDRLQNYTGTVYQPAQEGAPPGFALDVINPKDEKYDPRHSPAWNQGAQNHRDDDDSSDEINESCECIANTGRYGGEHCWENLYGKLCGAENCICLDYKYTGAGCPGPYLGQPCEENMLSFGPDTVTREPYTPRQMSKNPDCVCIDYVWRGSTCPPSRLGQPCTTRRFQYLDPDTEHFKSQLYGPTRLRAV